MKLWIVIILLIVNQCQGALQMNGTSSFVNFGDRDTIDGLSAFGIMTWAYMDSATPSYAGLMSDITPVAFDNGWTIQRLAVESAIFAAFRNASSSGHAGTMSGGFSSNSWHHLVVNYNGAGAANDDRVKIYVDGVIQTLDFGGTTIPSSIGANSSPLFIGTYDSATAGSFWGGFADDAVIVAGRVFTDNERAIHRQSKVRRLVSCNSHMGLDGYPHGLAIPNGSVIQDDGPNQFTGLATNCVAAASLFMSYP